MLNLQKISDYYGRLEEQRLNTSICLLNRDKHMQSLSTSLQTATGSQKVHLLFSYMKERGQENYEEDVSQYQHALQTAFLAKKSDADAALQTAALLHDIGHMLAEDEEGTINPTLKDDFHEDRGARFLSQFFPKAVTEPIRLHVEAKRYMCSTNETYFEGLSDASKKSFHLQGGKMSAEEIESFEKKPFYQAGITLRKWDDQAKLVGLKIPEIEGYEGVVERSLLEDGRS